MSRSGDAGNFGFKLQDGILPNRQLDPVCPVQFTEYERSSRQLLLHQFNPKLCHLKKYVKNNLFCSWGPTGLIFSAFNLPQWKHPPLNGHAGESEGKLTEC